MADLQVPQRNAVLSGPFWPGPVRVVSAEAAAGSIQIQAVGLQDGHFYDLTLTAEQFRTLVQQVEGSVYGFDAEPRLFRLAVEALRIHLAHAFDPQFAVSVSQVDPLPHQLDAVYRHMLPLPRIRFLLADDPGAGKTIMAGLLMRELMQRQDVRRVLVLCPKALTDQWRREMWERFRQRFVLLTGESIAGAFGQNAWIENDCVVASIDLAVQEHVLPGLEQANWDLIVFDEAHKLSAYRYGVAGKIDKTRRYQLAERLAEKTRHLLLMTATPHRGDDENFRLLLSLLDPHVFASLSGMRSALDKADSPYFLRRMKESMRYFDGRPIFLPRYVDTVGYELEPQEQALYDAVTDYVSTGLRQAESARNRNVGLALTVLQRRLASSLFAILRSLERRRARLAEQLEGRRSGRAAAPARELDLDEDEDSDELPEDEEEILSRSSMARTAEEFGREIAQLDGLIAVAQEAIARGPEKKLREFLDVVRDQTVSNQSEKILAFTEHRDTLLYLVQRLRDRGYSVCSIHGGMNLQDRIAAEKEFRGPAQFLVATDAAGEGINLQFCRIMVNWDLPWNPNRLEQRLGRIHRYGQEYEVHIYNLVASTTREGQVLIRLMAKLERMRELLGHDQVYDVIAGVLDSGRVRLDALIREAILHRRSLDDVLAELDFVDSEASQAAARDALGEALATAFIDLAFIGGEQRESKERRLTPEYVERFFVDALQYLGGRLTRGSDHDWRLDFVPAEIRRAATARNAGEFGAENRLVTFVKDRLRRDPQAEFLAPDHPLFDAVAERLLQLGRPALGRGSVFMDKRAREPYLLWLLDSAVVNGEGETVHKRLLGLRQRGLTPGPSPAKPERGDEGLTGAQRDRGDEGLTGSQQEGAGERFEPIAPGALLDLPPSDAAPAVPQQLRAAADAHTAVGAASSFYAGAYLSEVAAEQERQAAIVERALTRSIGDSLNELQARLERQQADEAKGKDMRLAIRTTSHEIDALTNELRARRAALAHRRVTAIQTPRVVGVAAVIPAPVPAAWEQGGDHSAVELAAMAVAEAYERAHGREPQDSSHDGVGYDLRSTGPNGEVRYIEVKGHAGSGDITLYYTEWQTAQRMREEFFIYDVQDALTSPRLRIVRDPVGKGIEPVERVVEYQISAEQIAAVAELIE